MVDFIESPRFPENISYGSSGGPGFKTFVFQGFSGIEQRQITWTRARAQYNAIQGIRDKDDMDDVRDFFYAVRGRAIGFRYKDWSDYQLNNELIGTGDGSTTTFSLIKTYGSATGNPYVRRIFKPVEGATFAVSVADVYKTVGTPNANRVSVDYTTGQITFGSSIIPSAGQAIRVTCEFDVPARFDTDVMAATHEGWQTETWDSIPIVELLLEDA